MVICALLTALISLSCANLTACCSRTCGRQDAATIVAELDKKKVPYHLSRTAERRSRCPAILVDSTRLSDHQRGPPAQGHRRVRAVQQVGHGADRLRPAHQLSARPAGRAGAHDHVHGRASIPRASICRWPSPRVFQRRPASAEGLGGSRAADRPQGAFRRTPCAGFRGWSRPPCPTSAWPTSSSSTSKAR